jgi:serine/threonine-protein kinase
MPLSPSDAEPWIHRVGEHRGRYEITARLGRGGYGEVYRVADEGGRPFAMKVVRLGPGDHRHAAERALIEAAVLKRIVHANVVAFEEAFVERDGAVVIVTEYLTGSTLREVGRGGALAAARALRLGKQLADAAAAVHAAGAVHRDIKPENVFVTAGDVVKLFDFGLVKYPGLSLTMRAVGTPKYMAPEQLAHGARPGAPLDPRWDVYAMGLVVFELLAGMHPFDVDRARAPASAAEVIERHLAGAVPRLEAVVEGLPPSLGDALARATARDPAARTSSAAVLANELAAARRAFVDTYGERAHEVTSELRRLGADANAKHANAHANAMEGEAAPSSEDARTLERAMPRWDAPPATERLGSPITGRFGTEPMVPQIDRAALIAATRSRKGTS